MTQKLSIRSIIIFQTLMRQADESQFHLFVKLLAEKGHQEFMAQKMLEELEKVKGDESIYSH